MMLYLPVNNKLKVNNLTEKMNSGWFGGAVLASLGTF